MSNLDNKDIQENVTNIPFGKRIIGIEDPQKMTLEEFNKSEDLLFHGSNSPLVFDRQYNYNSEDFTTRDGSLTLGLGFYTTPDQEQAENYSFVRQPNPEEGHLFVTSLLPNNSVMLDLRERNSLSNNAPYPKELFEKWKETYIQSIRNPSRNKTEWWLEAFETQYLEHLDKLSNLQSVDLRSMLWTGPEPRLRDGWYPSPPWCELFAQFMRNNGYDGVIYIEGGEGEKQKDSPTYCFYNTEKIGSYETWHPKQY